MIYRPLPSIHQRSPEMRLVLAVFEDAIRTAAQRPTGRSRRAQRDYLEARAWVQDTDHSWPFAFPNVCDLLGLDADAVRQQVLRGQVAADPDERRRRSGRSRWSAAHARIRNEPGRDASQRSAAAPSREPAW